MKNNAIRRKTVSLLFILGILVPFFFGLSGKILHRRLDVSVGGYADSVEKPAFGVKNFISGSFQKDFEKWFTNSFQPRNLIIKVYNQIQLVFFGKGSRIVGKDGYLFEDGYIISELCMNGAEYSAEDKIRGMEEYVAHLESISRKLEARGKVFVVYMTPSKANFFRDKIPDSWAFQEVKGVTQRDCFLKVLENHRVPFLNAADFVGESKTPLFYKTGIHWSRPAEQEFSRTLVEWLRKATGKNIRPIQLGELKSSKDPYWRDADMLELLSVSFFKKYDDCYYEYESVPQTGEFDDLHILLQGGSFGEGFLMDYFGTDSPCGSWNVFYNQGFRHDGLKESIAADFSDFDISILDSVDAVIFEVNEAVPGIYSSGFAEFLDSALDKISGGK